MLKNRFFQNTLHQINTDFDGVIIKSDKTLFDVKIGSNIADFHPIFISALPLLISQETNTISFPGVNFISLRNKLFCDIAIRKELDFIVIFFFNFSNSYTVKQKKIQEHNEKDIRRHLSKRKPAQN